MAIIELPVRGDLPSFEFKIELEGVVYTLKFRWNERMARWLFSIANEVGQDIVAGLPVQTDVDIKGRFKGSTLPPGLFLSLDETGAQRNPDRETFGEEVKFLYEEASG